MGEDLWTCHGFQPRLNVNISEETTSLLVIQNVTWKPTETDLPSEWAMRGPGPTQHQHPGAETVSTTVPQYHSTPVPQYHGTTVPRVVVVNFKCFLSFFIIPMVDLLILLSFTYTVINRYRIHMVYIIYFIYLYPSYLYIIIFLPGVWLTVAAINIQVEFLQWTLTRRY